MKKALIVVDVQQDFCEGGSLAVTGGNEVARRVKEYVEKHRPDYATIIASRDFHIDPGKHFSDAPDYVDTWPHHCVAGTSGAEFHPALADVTFDAIFDKGARSAAYDAFEGIEPQTQAGLEDYLTAQGIDGVDVVGLALDYCVKATALTAAQRGYPTQVLLPLTAGVAEATSSAAMTELKTAGVEMVSSM